MHDMAEQFAFAFAQVEKGPGEDPLRFGRANDHGLGRKGDFEALIGNHKLHNDLIADSDVALETLQAKPA